MLANAWKWLASRGQAMLPAEVERAVKHISMLVFVLVALACETTSHAPPTTTPSAPTGVPPMPVPIIETTEVLAPPTPSLDDVDVLDEPEEEVEEVDEVVLPPGTRAIHPHGGMSDCLEMYSACSPDPASPGTQRCTSAPLLLACGQSGTIPGGDTLVCVCP